MLPKLDRRSCVPIRDAMIRCSTLAIRRVIARQVNAAVCSETIGDMGLEAIPSIESVSMRIHFPVSPSKFSFQEVLSTSCCQSLRHAGELRLHVMRKTVLMPEEWFGTVS